MRVREAWLTHKTKMRHLERERESEREGGICGEEAVVGKCG